MKDFKAFLACSLWVLLLPQPSFAQDSRYILSPAIIQTDKAAYAFRTDEQLQQLHGRFRGAVEAQFPGLHRPLTLTDILDPSQPTVLLVPQLTVARLSQSSVAGSLDRYEAILVGDISVMDPWTHTRLFSATRMVTRAKELSRDGYSDAQREQAIQESFEEAGRAWIKECLVEIKLHAHPFTLKAELLPSQSGVRLRGGGAFWPFGSHEGLNRSATLKGPNRKTLKVREVFTHFAVVYDSSNPTATLEPGPVFEAMLVRDEAPAERVEPRVVIEWAGDSSGRQEEFMRAPLSKEGWLGLLANYLGKDGRFRILPIPPAADGSATTAWDSLKDHLKRFSGQTKESFTQDVVAKLAQDDPDVRVELGIANAYYGTAPGEQGSLDHSFHVVWALRWFEKSADSEDGEEGGRLLFKGVEFHSERIAVRTKPGLRELDLDSVWFNLCRNGIIRISKLVTERLRPAVTARKGLVQSGGKVAWPGQQAPAPHTRLLWRRAQGVVRNQAGKDLGTYFGKGERIPFQKIDRCDPGDELLFDSVTTGPLVSFLPIDFPEGPGHLKTDWLRARLATQLLKAMPMELEFLGPNERAGSKDPLFLKLRIDSLTEEALGDSLKLGGTLRLRLYKGNAKGEFDAQLEPLFKLGLGRSGPFPLGLPYQPGNAGEALLTFQNLALDELVKRATTGLTQALSKE